MALILNALLEVLRRPSLFDVAVELAAFAAPLWLAVLAGLVIGWAWRPRWAPVACSLGAADAVGAADRAVSVSPSFVARGSSGEPERPVAALSSSPAVTPRSKELAVTDEDLGHLFRLVEVTDGGPAWMKMMDRSIPNMTYQAWRRDPETGPPQYRSSTIYEDVTPDVVRDFFGDDDFRIKNGWDDMLISFNILEECPTTGTMIVQWVRKFPFFCSDREYIIGRRIWTSGGAYYCVTKGVPYPSVPRRDRPRRVDLYYSSWCIRPAESKKDGQMTACEVLLFHHEDMGIPWEIAKLGVRQGMWGCVKKIEPGLRAYQAARMSNEPLSQSATMAQINTKFDADQLRLLDANTDSSSDNIIEAEKPKHWACSIPKMVIVGGAVAVACTLDHGLLTKAVIFGVVRRFAKLGRRL